MQSGGTLRGKEYEQAHLSTQQPSSQENTRVPGAYVNAGRPSGTPSSQGQGAQAPYGLNGQEVTIQVRPVAHDGQWQWQGKTSRSLLE